MRRCLFELRVRTILTQVGYGETRLLYGRPGVGLHISSIAVGNETRTFNVVTDVVYVTTVHNF